MCRQEAHAWCVPPAPFHTNANLRRNSVLYLYGFAITLTTHLRYTCARTHARTHALQTNSSCAADFADDCRDNHVCCAVEAEHCDACSTDNGGLVMVAVRLNRARAALSTTLTSAWPWQRRIRISSARSKCVVPPLSLAPVQVLHRQAVLV